MHRQAFLQGRGALLVLPPVDDHHHDHDCGDCDGGSDWDDHDYENDDDFMQGQGALLVHLPRWSDHDDHDFGDRHGQIMIK